MYLILATAFFATIIIGLILLSSIAFRLMPIEKCRKFLKGYIFWLLIYALFILFGTGVGGSRLYEPSTSSPYKLPWKNGISHFVSQGNRSFTSHRGIHLYAWDFWMSIGTEVLAAREGTVIKVRQDYDGIGLYSNSIKVEHADGTHAVYGHIKKDGALVHIGDHVKQGQAIALSGMVGQTINPHLHFVVLNQDETASLPINFSDVPDGVPLAGHSYTSGNIGR